jgi:hypothetical protein
VSEGTPALACAEPSKKYPAGRTGALAGYQAHLKVNETPCRACREGAAAHSRARSAKLRENRHPGYACERPTLRYPEGRTGTAAGYSAHCTDGEEPCRPCVGAWSARTAQRTANLGPDELKRQRARAAKNARLRNTNACLVATPLHPTGCRGTATGHEAHIAARQGSCPSCREASLEHWSACERPTSKYPSGRKGTKSGYLAHIYAKEPACTPCREGHVAAQARARADDPVAALSGTLWSKYRLSVDAYKAMLAEQGGACAICGVDSPTDVRTSRFHVDHDHACCPGSKSCGRCVRGLLCHACNTALGNFSDDPKRLTAALAYLDGRKTDHTRPGLREQRYRRRALAGSGAV